MKSSIKVIEFTAITSAVFLLLTYLVSVNAEARVLKLDTVWLSNDFAFAVFGGAFASMLVVFICEIRKYLTVKNSTEEYIYYQALYLYNALFLMQQSICDYQKNPNISVPENLLDGRVRMVRSQLFALESTDYAPFRQNGLLSAHQEFCGKTAADLQLIMMDGNSIKIAIKKAMINRLQQNIPCQEITSADEPVQTVLSIQLDRISNTLEKVDQYLREIDGYCNQRYDWERHRQLIQSSYVSKFEAWIFEEEFPVEA